MALIAKISIRSKQYCAKLMSIMLIKIISRWGCVDGESIVAFGLLTFTSAIKGSSVFTTKSSRIRTIFCNISLPFNRKTFRFHDEISKPSENSRIPINSRTLRSPFQAESLSLLHHFCLHVCDGEKAPSPPNLWFSHAYKFGELKNGWEATQRFRSTSVGGRGRPSFNETFSFSGPRARVAFAYRTTLKPFQSNFRVATAL